MSLFVKVHPCSCQIHLHVTVCQSTSVFLSDTSTCHLLSKYIRVLVRYIYMSLFVKVHPCSCQIHLHVTGCHLSFQLHVARALLCTISSVFCCFFVCFFFLFSSPLASFSSPLASLSFLLSPCLVLMCSLCCSLPLSISLSLPPLSLSLSPLSLSFSLSLSSPPPSSLSIYTCLSIHLFTHLYFLLPFLSKSDAGFDLE